MASPPRLSHVIWNGIPFLKGNERVVSSGRLGELGVRPLDPQYYPDDGGLRSGSLAEDRVLQGVQIKRGREVWFHPDGKLWVVKGTGLSQEVQGRRVQAYDSIYFKPDGSIERIQPPLPER